MKRRDALKLAALAPLAPLAGCAANRSQTATTATTVSVTATEIRTATAVVGGKGASISMLNPSAYPQEPTQFGLHMPGIVDTVPTVPGARTIALTFDACNGEVDEALLDTLREHHIPATLFLAQPWVEAHPDVARRLIGNPLFMIGNHGTRHLPLAVRGQAAYGIPGTASPAEAIAEVAGNDRLLRELGADPVWFRAGTAHYDDVAVRIANDGGVKIGGFNVNGDFGATAGAAEVAHQILGAPDGSIVLAHMNHPGSGTAAGVAQAVAALGGGVRFAFIDGTVPAPA